MLHIPRHIRRLPYQAINRILSLNLEHDTVHLSEKAIRHIRDDHPKDYALCIASMDAVIATPDYVGQAPQHRENYELIKCVGEVVILVALSTLQNEYGKYPVQSSYLIDRNALRRRIRKGYLRPL